MPRPVKAKQNLALADKLEAWAKKYLQLEDTYVSGLLAALRDNKNLHVWATLNPMDYLPIVEGSSGAKLIARTRLIIVLRNVLVFAPVALTWLAVGEATKGFAKYVNENATGVVNFLDFWENGYGILADEWRISHVAILDFQIILAVIVLTLVASVLGQRGSKMQNKAVIQADRDRNTIAVEIASFLHEKQRISTVTMNQSLAGAISKLVSATNALESTSKNIQKTAKGFTPEKIAKPARGFVYEELAAPTPKKKRWLR
jgi:hypothetical protein